VRPNDFARSSKGDFYVSDPGAYQKATQGGATPTGPVKTGLYWVNPKGKVTLVADDITFPMAWRSARMRRRSMSPTRRANI
jgi:sugar lactone lactonase YvrE